MFDKKHVHNQELQENSKSELKGLCVSHLNRVLVRLISLQ